ncbi:MAG: 4'-phosphopantetheinyl transferase superfamily protein [Candidatus Accumulibacter sp.]|nr:4'-phosphopantetheinyl transferase superfamily protein [Accumulibacter sp.]
MAKKADVMRVISLLPEEQANSIARNVREQDRMLRLLARLMLAQAVFFLEGRACADTLGALITLPLGRPELPDGKWKFSFSHSQNLAVCLIGSAKRYGRLGVDVEAWRDLRPEDIAPAFCPEEHRYLAEAIDDLERQRRLFDLWTRKEAVLKANGTGLLLNPAEVNMCSAIPLPAMPKLSVRNIAAAQFAGYSLAFALEGRTASVEIIRITEVNPD